MIGVSSFRIITRHITPNVMHIMLISVVMDFSGLVLVLAANLFADAVRDAFDPRLSRAE